MAAAEIVVDNASRTLVPSTVQTDDLERAGGALAASELVGNGLVGPAVGGLLLAVSPELPLGAIVFVFVLAALIAALIPKLEAANRGTAAVPRRSMTREGVNWLRRQPLLLRLALLSLGLGASSAMAAAVFVLFASEDLGLTSIEYGLLLVPGAAGGVAGSLLAGRLSHSPLSRTLAIVVVVSGLSWLLLSTQTNPFIVAALLATASGAVLLWNVRTVAVRQRLTPDELLGRVNASYGFLVLLGMPAGAIAGGLIANAWGVRFAIASSGVMLVAIGLIIQPLLAPWIDEADAGSVTSPEDPNAP